MGTALATVEVIPAMPDLVVTSVTCKPFSFFKSGLMFITTHITNVGMISSADCALLVENVTAGKRQSYAVSRLAPGESLTKVTLFLAVPKKTVTVRASIDPENLVPEMDESNNTVTVTKLVP